MCGCVCLVKCSWCPLQPVPSFFSALPLLFLQDNIFPELMKAACMRKLERELVHYKCVRIAPSCAWGFTLEGKRTPCLVRVVNDVRVNEKNMWLFHVCLHRLSDQFHCQPPPHHWCSDAKMVTMASDWGGALWRSALGRGTFIPFPGWSVSSM